MSSNDFLFPFRETKKKRLVSATGSTILMLLSIILLAVSQNLLDFLIIYIICLIFYLSLGGKYFKTLNLILNAYIIIFFLGLPSLFMRQGEPFSAITIGSFQYIFYDTSVFRALGIWIRGLFSVSIISLYTTTITMQEFIQSLRMIFVPNIMVTIILLILRYTPMLYQQGDEIKTAQELRGIETASFKRKFAAATSRIGGTLIRSIRQGTSVYEAMVLRGLDNTEIVKRQTLKWLDFILIPIVSGALTLIAGGVISWLI